MLNHPVLNIAISLAFIYLIYSLLASVLSEIIAQIFKSRPRMLVRGIEQLLDGENYSSYWAKGKKKNLFAQKIVSHPLYRRMARRRQEDCHPSYLTADTFSDIVMNVLKEEAARVNNKPEILDAPVLLEDIRALVKNPGWTDAKDDLKKILTIYLNQANGDVQRFKLILESWYDDMMDRVSGWYKKINSGILFLLGLGLAISLNVDSIDMTRRLSKDKTLAARMADSAAVFVATHPNIKDSTKAPEIFKKAYEQYIAKEEASLGLGLNSLSERLDKKNGLEQIGILVVALMGWTLTALAIMMGAPFWFDTLSRLVNLRATGKRPKSSNNYQLSKTPLANAKKPDSDSFA